MTERVRQLESTETTKARDGAAVRRGYQEGENGRTIASTIEGKIHMIRS